jgi:hypothetical protein
MFGRVLERVESTAKGLGGGLAVAALIKRLLQKPIPRPGRYIHVTLDGIPPGGVNPPLYPKSYHKNLAHLPPLPPSYSSVAGILAPNPDTSQVPSSDMSQIPETLHETKKTPTHFESAEHHSPRRDRRAPRSRRSTANQHIVVHVRLADLHSDALHARFKSRYALLPHAHGEPLNQHILLHFDARFKSLDPRP